MRGWAGLLAVIGLQGCTTTSFAPPYVEMRKVAEQGDGKGPLCGLRPGQEDIGGGIKGAGRLIDNFLHAYRCAEHRAADSRQHFEVPGMLVGLGGAVAAAAGAPAAAALGTGATVAGLNGAKGYYGPRARLRILAASVDALVCIKRVSVGLDPQGSTLLTAAATDAAKNLAFPTAPTDGGTRIVMDAVRQYYESIEGALLSVENISAQHLSDVGTYAPGAILAEIETIKKAQDQSTAEEDKKTSELKSAAQAAAKTGMDSKSLEDVDKSEKETVFTLPIAPGKSVAADSSAMSLLTKKGALDDAGRAHLDATIRAKLEAPDTRLSATDGKLDVVDIRHQELARETLSNNEQAASRALIYIDQIQPKLDACVIRAKM